ncbi:MAG: TonB-dependent receptor, partial [Candidatus Eremiobacteraeota bacterium]|nr:TonB-dependent receptor [Candidatus Eremiobacteraeota bacterium]
LNFTAVSKGGGGVFQVIPWYRYSRIAYDGDLANDVLGTQPDPNTGLPVNNIGLRQDRASEYVGLRLSQLFASKYHAVKVGADFSRENLDANETFAQFGQPNIYTSTSQAGSQVGVYVQDKWTPSRAISVNGGLRYDRSSGFVGDHMISPRIGVNLAPDDKNIVHFYYGRIYAAPALEDVRQACVLLNGCPTEPVYDLKPEKDAYWEMGVAHTFSPLMTGYVNYFNRTAVNVLDTTQLLNTPLFAVFNNRRGRAEGVELRLQGRTRTNADTYFLSTTLSSAQAQGVSGSTFLFPPDAVSDTSWQPEDHDQTLAANAAYTHRFGASNKWFATLEGEYGSGYPVQFESGEGRLPSHTTLDLGIGRDPSSADHSLGFALDVDNLLNHQYFIKIANGFNTTQISAGRKVLLRLTAPL